MKTPAFRSPARLLAANAGAVAVEFAVALPLLILMLLGFVELDRYGWAVRQIENTASSMAMMLTQSTNDVKPVDIKFAKDSVQVLLPRVLQDSARVGHKWSDEVEVTMSSVAFSTAKKCAGACSYTAQVQWSSGSDKRPCKTSLSPAPDDAAPTPTTLPSDAFGPGSVIVVDLAYDYKPIFMPSIFGALKIRRSSYMQPRYAASLPYSEANGDANVTTCS